MVVALRVLRWIGVPCTDHGPCGDGAVCTKSCWPTGEMQPAAGHGRGGGGGGGGLKSSSPDRLLPLPFVQLSSGGPWSGELALSASPGKICHK